MADALYLPFKAAALKGLINLETDDVRAVLYDTNDVAFSESHEFLSSVAAALVGTPVALTNKVVGADGTFDADDVTLATVTGDQSEAILLYIHTGNNATSRLVAKIDSATGLPVTPSGGNIPIVWSNGANKIFKL